MKTHCKHGHALEGENLYVEPSGHRQCRECKRKRDEVRRESEKRQTYLADRALPATRINSTLFCLWLIWPRRAHRHTARVQHERADRQPGNPLCRVRQAHAGRRAVLFQVVPKESEQARPAAPTKAHTLKHR